MSVCEAKVSPAKLIPAGLAIVAATYGLARYTYGLFVPDIQREFGLTTEAMGLIASGSYAGYLLATLLGSWVSGIIGPRLPVVLGGSSATAGMTLISQAADPWILAFGVFLAGTSPGLAYPPLSDAVMRLIAQPLQNRTYAIINSGTSVGVIFAGPAALLAGADWRWAWAAFAVFAAVATLWNARLMPSGSHAEANGGVLPRLSRRWLLGGAAPRLFLAATLFGVVTAVYWTFAVDLLIRQGTLAHDDARLFWLLIGAFGLLGGAAGDLVTRFGLRRTFRYAVLAIALAMAAPALWPGQPFFAYLSGMAFGATFILITGLFGIWSVNVFHDRPSAGFGATFFLISAGQLIGPAMAGVIAGASTMAVAFYLAAAACVVTLALGPRHDLFTMARTDKPSSPGKVQQPAAQD